MSISPVPWSSASRISHLTTSHHYESRSWRPGTHPSSGLDKGNKARCGRSKKASPSPRFYHLLARSSLPSPLPLPKLRFRISTLSPIVFFKTQLPSSSRRSTAPATTRLRHPCTAVLAIDTPRPTQPSNWITRTKSSSSAFLYERAAPYSGRCPPSALATRVRISTHFRLRLGPRDCS